MPNQKCRAKNLVFSNTSLMAISARDHPSESAKARHSQRCKIGGKLVLITRESYMSFRLVPKSVIVNDLERRNGHYIALFYTYNRVDL